MKNVKKLLLTTTLLTTCLILTSDIKAAALEADGLKPVERKLKATQSEYHMQQVIARAKEVQSMAKGEKIPDSGIIYGKGRELITGPLTKASGGVEAEIIDNTFTDVSRSEKEGFIKKTGMFCWAAKHDVNEKSLSREEIRNLEILKEVKKDDPLRSPEIVRLTNEIYRHYPEASREASLLFFESAINPVVTETRGGGYVGVNLANKLVVGGKEVNTWLRFASDMLPSTYLTPGARGVLAFMDRLIGFSEKDFNSAYLERKKFLGFFMNALNTELFGEAKVVDKKEGESHSLVMSHTHGSGEISTAGSYNLDTILSYWQKVREKDDSIPEADILVDGLAERLNMLRSYRLFPASDKIDWDSERAFEPGTYYVYPAKDSALYKLFAWLGKKDFDSVVVENTILRYDDGGQFEAHQESMKESRALSASGASAAASGSENRSGIEDAVSIEAVEVRGKK